jgi:hypothetical protein
VRAVAAASADPETYATSGEADGTYDRFLSVTGLEAHLEETPR